MAVQSDTSRIQYAGNSSTTTSYAVPFVFQENSHLKAIARTSAGVESVVTLTNHTGAGNVNGGTVRTAVAVPVTSTLTIYREVPATQTTTYAEGGDFPAASHERALDKLTQIAQQLDRKVGSAIRLSAATQLPDLNPPLTNQQHILSSVGGAAPSWQALPSLSIGPVIATGSTAARSVQDRFADVINVKDFGAVGDGATDDTAAIQAAINAATTNYAGKCVYLPAGVYKTTSPLSITRGCSIIGDAPIGYDFSKTQDGGFPTSPSISGGVSIGGGTWLFLSHTGKGVVLDGSASPFGNCIIRSLGTFRNQPAPATSYAPTNHDWDFSLEFVQDVTMQDIVLLNATKGIYASQAGRFNFYNITGQPLQAGILINESYGVVKIDNVLFNATIWKNDINVHSYMRNNLVALEMRRSDNPQVSNFFSIYPKIGILFSYNAAAVLGSGYTSRALLTNIGIDGTGEASIKFDAAADNTTASITNFYVFGRAGSLVGGTPTIAGPNGWHAESGILCEADSVYLALTNVKASYFGEHIIKVSGANSRVVASDLVIDNWNQDNGGHAALHAETTNQIHVANKIVNFGSNNGAAVVNNASRVQTSEWITFTPTVTSTSGTITTASASLRYKVENDHVEYYGEATITTNGTGAGSIQLTIPIDNASSACGFAGYGRFCVTSGDAASVRVFTNRINISTYNNAYPATNGTVLIFGGVYRI